MLECVYFYSDFTSKRYMMDEATFDWALSSLQMSSNTPLALTNGDVIRMVVYDMSNYAEHEVMNWTIGHPVDWEAVHAF